LKKLARETKRSSLCALLLAAVELVTDDWIPRGGEMNA
jgi:hypothetical protein